MSDHVKRSFTRFNAEPGTLARIDTRADAASFEPTIVGLVYEESYKGCGLVVVGAGAEGMLVGEKLRVQVGELPPLSATVRWRKVLDTRILKIGLEYAA